MVLAEPRVATVKKPAEQWYRWAVVVPTNRPEKFREFREAWRELFDEHGVILVVIEDGPKKSDLLLYNQDVHLTWQDVPDFIPRRTDMIRSWGFYHVWKEKLADLVLTLDDDVKPGELDPFTQYELRFTTGSVFSEYFSVGSLTSAELEMRGFPYKDRKRADVAVQYGGWSGVLDFDAATQLALPQSNHRFHEYTIPVPKGAAVTGCIMNMAYDVKYTPIMWQLTMLDGRYNRIGDIWSGLFIKRTLDSIGKVMLINGHAAVKHDRASDPYTSLQKEAPSVWLNDHLWEALPVPRDPADMMQAYREITAAAADFFAEHDEQFTKKFMQDRALWLKLFPAAG